MSRLAHPLDLDPVDLQQIAIALRLMRSHWEVLGNDLTRIDELIARIESEREPW